MSTKKNILVVGASGAIGSALARQLAHADVRIGLHYCHNREKAVLLRDDISSAGCMGVLLQSNLDSAQVCADFAEAAIQEFGTIHALALCGGRLDWTPWQQLDESKWQQTFFQHCVAPFSIVQRLVPSILAAHDGRIVYLSSISPKYGGSVKTLHYAAAKAALETAMYGLSRQLCRNGIRINGVRAGFVDTPLQREGRSAEELAERVAKIPLGRAGKPEEIASAMAYLLTEQAGFINGEIITVAGGD
ncbi:3-oxoacyl-[acyl-carrier-protein] reductase FabG [Anaerolineae bacterium]|nr:3-oxoacyl-[acyl-carrier-protein] reductase FabG [Anaerolineae bacterium]